MNKLLLSVLFLATTAAHAQTAIVADTYTKHSSDCQEAYSKTCEPWQQPRRVSIQHNLTETITADVGFGTNSYGKFSASVGALYQPLQTKYLKAGVFAALVSGYTCEQLRTCFVAGGLAATITPNDRVFVQILFVPAVGDGTVSVINTRIGVNF
jgi:hypothetical protein